MEFGWLSRWARLLIHKAIRSERATSGPSDRPGIVRVGPRRTILDPEAIARPRFHLSPCNGSTLSRVGQFLRGFPAKNNRDRPTMYLIFSRYFLHPHHPWAWGLLDKLNKEGGNFVVGCERSRAWRSSTQCSTE